MEKPGSSSSLGDLARMARAVRRAMLPALCILLPLLFLWVYLILVQQPVGPRSPVVAVPADSAAPFRTNTAFFVYAVLLSGMIGSLLKHVLIRAKEPARSEGGPALVETAIFLFVGTIAAFAVAVLLPTALLVRASPTADLFEPVNKWGLIVLGAAVGYASRETLSDVAATFKRLFEGAGGAGLADLESRVEAGLKAAIAPSPLVNFSGTIDLQLRDDEGRSCIAEGKASLASDKPHSLAVTVRSGSHDIGETQTAITQPFAISDGVDAEEVVFELIVDAGSLQVPLRRQVIRVPASTSGITASFDFVPKERGEIPAAGPEEPVAADVDEPLIHVFLYQGPVMCRSVKLPVRFVGTHAVA